VRPQVSEGRPIASLTHIIVNVRRACPTPPNTRRRGDCRGQSIPSGLCDPGIPCDDVVERLLTPIRSDLRVHLRGSRADVIRDRQCAPANWAAATGPVKAASSV